MVHCKMYLCVLLLFVVLQLVASWPAAAFIGDPPQFSGDCYGLKGRLPGERCAPRPPPPPAPPVRPASVDALNKKKRYPMHLDPLYQYRLLARSGQCPKAKDGQSEYYCPTPNKAGNWKCIDDFELCDGVRNCPNGEDELPVSCLFFRVIESHLDSVSERLDRDEQRKPR